MCLEERSEGMVRLLDYRKGHFFLPDKITDERGIRCGYNNQHPSLRHRRRCPHEGTRAPTTETLLGCDQQNTGRGRSHLRPAGNRLSEKTYPVQRLSHFTPCGTGLDSSMPWPRREGPS